VKTQKKLEKGMNSLSEQIINSQQKVNSIFETINLQIEALSHLQSAIFGEFLDFGAILFTLGLVALAWVLSGFKRTEAVRLQCVTLAACNLIIERSFMRPTSTTSSLTFGHSMIYWSRTLMIMAIGYIL